MWLATFHADAFRFCCSYTHTHTHTHKYIVVLCPLNICFPSVYSSFPHCPLLPFFRFSLLPFNYPQNNNSLRQRLRLPTTCGPTDQICTTGTSLHCLKSRHWFGSGTRTSSSLRSEGFMLQLQMQTNNPSTTFLGKVRSS